MRLAPRSYCGRLDFVRSVINGEPLKFLDVGNLGDGTSTNMLNKEHVESFGGEYHGLDSNQELTDELKLPNQAVGDIHNTDYNDDMFDMVYLGEVIEHTWKPGDMVGECYRILKPGGRLVFDTPNPFSLSSLLRYVFLRRDSMGDNRRLVFEEARDNFAKCIDDGNVLHQPQHKIFFSAAMAKQILETHGFCIESIGFTRKFPTVLHRLLLWIFPHLGQHLCVVAQKATVEEAFKDVAS